MKSKTLFPALTGLVMTNWFLTLPSHAQHEQDAYQLIRDRECIGRIHTIHSDIENRLGGNVLAVRYIDPAVYQIHSRSPVRTRQMEVTFVLLSTENVVPPGRAALTQKEGSANIVLGKSPALVKKYAEAIIHSCSNVGSVSVNIWEIGVGWSVNSAMQLVQKRCVDIDTMERRGLMWGEHLCL